MIDVFLWLEEGTSNLVPMTKEQFFNKVAREAALWDAYYNVDLPSENETNNEQSS